MPYLLKNLSKYAPNKNNPTENFITEAFAYLLKNDMVFFEKFIILLQEKVSEIPTQLNIANSYEVETQYNISGQFPDMVWRDEENKHIVIFEHKVWSPLYQSQLAKYKKLFKETNKYSHVEIFSIITYLGQYKSKVCEKDITHTIIYWENIADLLNHLPSTDPINNWLREEFIQLLQSKGIINVKPVNTNILQYYNEVKSIDHALETLSKRTEKYDKWPLLKDEKYAFKQPSLYKKYGKVGMQFNTNISNVKVWAPAFFCGFVTDGTDHAITDLIKNSPLSIVNLDVHSSLIDKLLGNPAYKNFVNELVEKISKTNWVVSDRTTRNKYNKWHPLIIYCDLEVFLQGATSLEEQEIRCIEEFSKIQQFILDCPSFLEMCKLLRVS